MTLYARNREVEGMSIGIFMEEKKKEKDTSCLRPIERAVAEREEIGIPKRIIEITYILQNYKKYIISVV
mgnify:CR=1 FL=1